MFKISCYLIVQAPFINLRNIWEDTDRSIIFLRKLWLFFMCRYDVCLFQLVGKFWRTNWVIDVITCAFCKKVSFCAAFFGSRLWKVFLTSSMSIWRNLKTSELFLALVNLILGWSLYSSSIFKIGSCSDECGHLYPLFGIFKTAMLIKYSLNFLAIWSSLEIISSSSTKLILECFVTFCLKSSIINYNLSIKIAIIILFHIS